MLPSIAGKKQALSTDYEWRSLFSFERLKKQNYRFLGIRKSESYSPVSIASSQVHNLV